jgi:hypothetical protein
VEKNLATVPHFQEGETVARYSYTLFSVFFSRTALSSSALAL